MIWLDFHIDVNYYKPCLRIFLFFISLLLFLWLEIAHVVTYQATTTYPYTLV